MKRKFYIIIAVVLAVMEMHTYSMSVIAGIA